MAACAPRWNELLLGLGFHINKPLAVPAMLFAQEQGTLLPQKQGSGGRRWLTGGLWTPLLPLPPFSEVVLHCKRKVFFFPCMKSSSFHPKWFFHIWGFRDTCRRRIARLALQHSPIQRNYSLTDSLVMGKEGFHSKVIFIANLPVQLMWEKHNLKFPEDIFNSCWWHILFLKKRSLLHSNGRNSSKCAQELEGLLQGSNSTLQPAIRFTPSAFW